MDVHRGADRPLSAPALELRDVHVRFGDVRALDGASLRARAGTIHALLGENGAGKTTLMRVAYGMLRPRAGTIVIDGMPVRPESPADAIRAGIGMVHQHFTLVPAMTVAENVALGGLPQPGDAAGTTRRAGAWRHDASRTASLVRAIGDATGLRLDPGAMVSTLGIGARQRLEILKALARDARVLILDEPTAVLPPSEANELLRRLRRMADEGRTIVLITHKLREALAVADDVTVLRRGRTVLEGPAREFPPDRLGAAMLGDGGDAAVAETPPPRAVPMSPTARVVASARALEVRDEHGVSRIRDATFDIHGGEIVGVAAVEGSGHRELLRALAGRLQPAAGMLVLPDHVGFVPEDRHHDALALELSLAENVALRGAGARRGLVPWRGIARRTRELMATFDVRAPHERVPARSLSGGNQQKLVLARELDGAPAMLVAENPTRGLDVGATAAVHRRIREARDAGTAVVVHASDVDDVLALADRLLVVFDGTVREVPPDRDAAAAAMVGLA